MKDKQATYKERIFLKHKSDRILIFKKYKELCGLGT